MGEGEAVSRGEESERGGRPCPLERPVRLPYDENTLDCLSASQCAVFRPAMAAPKPQHGDSVRQAVILLAAAYLHLRRRRPCYHGRHRRRLHRCRLLSAPRNGHSPAWGQGLRSSSSTGRRSSSSNDNNSSRSETIRAATGTVPSGTAATATSGITSNAAPAWRRRR